MSQVSLGQCSSASRRAAPKDGYWRRSNMNRLFHHAGRKRKKKTAIAQVITFRPAILQPRLNPAGERAEIRNALQFVVGHLDVKVILQARKQIERLQAVDVEGLEEVLVGLQLVARHFEVLCGESQNFVQRLFFRNHHFALWMQPGFSLIQGKYGCNSVLS